MLASEIAELLPHGRGMSLIDEVVETTESSVVCRTKSHLRPDNPLRSDTGLHSASLVEYAAQAAAIHAGLSNSGLGSRRPAFIGGLKGFKYSSAKVCDSVEELYIEVVAELVSAGGAIFQFNVQGEGVNLASGRLTLVQP